MKRPEKGMKVFRRKKIFVLLALCAIVLLGILAFPHEDAIDFNTQVKPIINKKCISCHGGVKQQGGFSLLFKDEAMAATKSGKPAIIPGNPEDSELIKRLLAKDTEERMPYKHAPLSNEEISIFKKWIKQGAKWGAHWAYLPVKEVKIPSGGANWVRNAVDHFIYLKLDEAGLKPSNEADRATLLRRVSLDLIGMAPSDSIAKIYLYQKDSNQAYEKLVDALLASSAFGEKWASMWLDVARYADTKGYESDGPRNIWKYRDWVIRAFNADKPYNQFITEQIAGDFYVNPTDEQYIATAFHRNSMTNDEGGTSNEEYRVAAVIDRINTTWEGLLSTTFACVQCHSHPYDPIKHDEYYKFMAYFNNSRDEDLSTEYPLLKQFYPDMEAKLKELTAWLTAHVSEVKAKEIYKFLKTGQPSINSTTTDRLHNAVIGNNNIALYFRNHGIARIASVDLNHVDQLLCRFASKVPGGHMQLHLDEPDGPVLASWQVQAKEGYQIQAVDFSMQQGTHDVYVTYQNANRGKGEETLVYFDWFRFTDQFPGKGEIGYEEQKQNFWALLEAPPMCTTPIMVENPQNRQRKTFVFERGAWTSLGKEVQADVPAVFKYAMPENAPKNRMGLAMWLTDERNPLLSRTMVNRLWEQLFGTGIVETLEDMGTQGMDPTHRELLDYLSWQFMHDYKWSMKRLIKELVMSATYRQDSRMNDELKEKDLFNKFYARGPRIRLSAEQLRDQFLSVSMALSPKMYGKGVMPWQPDGIWNSPYNSAKWKNARGDDRYRRAIYTYWKRSAPYPSMITFDGAQRVVCNPRRIRTNTPLQALVTLNDSAYIDLARHFADRMQRKEQQVDDQIAQGYEWIMYKPIPTEKLRILSNLYQTAFNEYQAHPDRMTTLLGDKEKKDAKSAALLVVANTLFNLDEVVTKN